MLLLVLAVAFCCQAARGEYLDPHCHGKQVIVHLFEWKWTDVAAECERYLGPKGFCGVQVSPPHEHVVVTSPHAPWWQRYQPISYKLVSRSGNEAQFADMVRRCNAAGVRIYPDIVINHMSGTENHGQGSGGTSFDGGSLSYPGVPFTVSNFNPRSKCPSGDGHVNNYGDPNNVRNCYLLSLSDLDQSQEYVRQKIVQYLDHMLDLGVAGFRVDASKHMWPQDLAAIMGATKNTQFGGKPFYMHEVIDQNDGAIKVNEYYALGRVTEFRYCQKITEGVRNFGSLQGVFDPGWGMADNDHALIFVDNHDNQRGHGGGGQLITHKQPLEYRLATAFTLAWNYGFTRVMSSYSFDSSDQGPPHNGDYSTADVPINSDGSCGGGWVCEHRWHSIGNMAAFRNAVAGTDVNHFQSAGDVVGFARGNKGFFAMGKQSFDQTFQTGLPAGQYCDLISDCRVKVHVDGAGNAHLRPESGQDPIVAFVVGGPSGPSGVGGGTQSHTDPPAAISGSQTTPDYGSDTWRRTVILIEWQTQPGQDLFIRGGISHDHRSGCTTSADSSACAIPIRHRNGGTSTHFDKVKTWGVGDHYLDWYGAESGQGSYQGQAAQGTPALWTTNDHSSPGFTAINTFGPHYWMIDVDMDCSKTENSYFEVKAMVGGWEGDITPATCTGSGGGSPPFTSNNHIGRCGFVNVFHASQGRCAINPIP